VVIPVENFRNMDNHKLLYIARMGKQLPLWEVEQIHVQYGVFLNIPWSILGFRLKKGEDAKHCVEVTVEGTVKSQGVDIKGIWPSRKANDLSIFEMKYSSGRQFQIGLDLTEKTLTSLTLTMASEHSSRTGVIGQTLVSDFQKQQFKVMLGVMKGSPSGMCVADLVEFFVLVQLSKEHIPMTFEVEANVVTGNWFGKRKFKDEKCTFTVEKKSVGDVDLRSRRLRSTGIIVSVILFPFLFYCSLLFLLSYLCFITILI